MPPVHPSIQVPKVPFFLFNPPGADKQTARPMAVLAGAVSQFSIQPDRPTDATLLLPHHLIYKQAQGLKRSPQPASYALPWPWPMSQQTVSLGLGELPMLGVIDVSPRACSG